MIEIDENIDGTWTISASVPLGGTSPPIFSIPHTQTDTLNRDRMLQLGAKIIGADSDIVF